MQYYSLNILSFKSKEQQNSLKKLYQAECVLYEMLLNAHHVWIMCERETKTFLADTLRVIDCLSDAGLVCQMDL